MVIVKNDFVIVAGSNLLNAFDYLEVSEFSAKSLVMSKILGEMIPINDAQIEDIRKVMHRWKNYDWNI